MYYSGTRAHHTCKAYSNEDDAIYDRGHNKNTCTWYTQPDCAYLVHLYLYPDYLILTCVGGVLAILDSQWQ